MPSFMEAMLPFMEGGAAGPARNRSLTPRRETVLDSPRMSVHSTGSGQPPSPPQQDGVPLEEGAAVISLEEEGGGEGG